MINCIMTEADFYHSKVPTSPAAVVRNDVPPTASFRDYDYTIKSWPAVLLEDDHRQKKHDMRDKRDRDYGRRSRAAVRI
jgi:hypothetical protein